MHGDFMAQEKDEKLIGGVSMLSGYLNKVRKEEKNEKNLKKRQKS